MKRPNAFVFLVTVTAAAYVGSLAFAQGSVTNAPTGMAGESNGFDLEFCRNQAALTDSPNSPEIPDDECNFAAALAEFTGPETIADGLGPIFNAAGCGECHMVPSLGGFSQVTEKRAGFLNSSNTFFDHPGGSLLQDRANSGAVQETLQTAPSGQTTVLTLRGSLSVLGDGFVEAISSNTLERIRDDQPSSMRGQIIDVPVLERPGSVRAGRFGWKNQQASLVSFSADAYVNEMGITSPLQPVENTSNGTIVTDPVAGLDDEGVDVELFALFMRSTVAPSRGRITQNVLTGESLFRSVGCETCHTSEIITAAPNSTINGGALRVANALGNKRIRPFGDFMLHDIGTGDGIVQNGGASTRNKVRTVPLWGLRVRGRFMHDGLSFSVADAIQRHGNQAAGARAEFNRLSSTSRARVIEFLNSL